MPFIPSDLIDQWDQLNCGANREAMVAASSRASNLQKDSFLRIEMTISVNWHSCY